MPNLSDLKNRIASVKSTRKITKAMQMVASPKLRRAQDAAQAGRLYAERFNAVMAGFAASVGASEGGPKLLAGTGSGDVATPAAQLMPDLSQRVRYFKSAMWRSSIRRGGCPVSVKLSIRASTGNGEILKIVEKVIKIIHCLFLNRFIWQDKRLLDLRLGL